jgi:ribosomal protein S18 acetylase RimI-like enzyme
MGQEVTSAGWEVRRAEPSDLRGIISIISSLPGYFVTAAGDAVRRSFPESNTAVAVRRNRIVGFLMWRTDGVKIEILWAGVRSEEQRRGVGTAMFEALLEAVISETEVFVLTATPDSNIPGTQFDGSLYAGTADFYKRLGFKEIEILRGHWGEENHALKMARPILSRCGLSC